LLFGFLLSSAFSQTNAQTSTLGSAQVKDINLVEDTNKENNNNNNNNKEEDKPKPYALIFGTVWDPHGHSVYGIKIKIRRASEKKARWEVYSNHTGEFAQRVPPGEADYIVSADVKGYRLPSGKKFKPGSEVTVHIKRDERSDIGLHLDWY
jgi:hypothetical protein